MIQIMKRNKTLVNFDKDKIINAINKAFLDVDEMLYDTNTACNIADEIENIAYEMDGLKAEAITVENIQDLVEDFLMRSERRDVAKSYIRYRHKKELQRQSNTTDQTIFELLNNNNEYWNTENSNKNAKIVTVQRDYIAGITSTDIAKRFLLPPEVCKAHELGIIHQHDMDYMAQNALTNCCLINLEDMLQNGTRINDILIEAQHRLSTAVTVTTQIITAVASSQYGLAS